MYMFMSLLWRSVEFNKKLINLPPPKNKINPICSYLNLCSYFQLLAKWLNSHDHDLQLNPNSLIYNFPKQDMKASKFSCVFWRLGTNPVSQRRAQKWKFFWASAWNGGAHGLDPIFFVLFFWQLLQWEFWCDQLAVLSVKLRDMGFRAGSALFEFRTQHCLRICPCVPVRTPILPIFRNDRPNCLKNASWLLAKCSTSLIVRRSLKSDSSDVNRPRFFFRFLKYWLSNWSGVIGSLKNCVLLS